MTWEKSIHCFVLIQWVASSLSIDLFVVHFPLFVCAVLVRNLAFGRDATEKFLTCYVRVKLIRAPADVKKRTRTRQ